MTPCGAVHSLLHHPAPAQRCIPYLLLPVPRNEQLVACITRCSLYEVIIICG